MDEQTLHFWEERIAHRVRNNAVADVAHDVQHVERVVRNAKRIARCECADLAVVMPAAWLHDLVAIPKDSPERCQASSLAAVEAMRFLRSLEYPETYLAPIAHAIEAHSFSARIEPRTVEAEVVQDADRLDALGAIGIARCFATTGAMGRALYCPDDPFGSSRGLDDKAYALDHFELKLFCVAESLRTQFGRREGQRRAEFLRAFVAQLQLDIGA